ncbi:substrate-binding periplasmic protein [Aeromonas veronii]|uniref:substrate-binding periplasmic protein n=1 Tax=Aeromonas veronii TaxID=654 RepID=UPI0004CE6498|nr:transporter substrate-binding domain-containing protein [Aeromonas veronii]QMS74779.1 transporter substrate-binding domain-containing protein [Aeromonas veronii Hm21]
MRYWCWFLLLFSLSGWSHPLIKVGGYPYAPFVVKLPDSRYEGLTLELIDQLNTVQKEVTFVFVPTSAVNRYKALDLGRFSLMLFEDTKWGWDTDKFKMTTPFLGGGEVYVALNKAGRDQRFFDDPASHHLIGVTGYHYGVGQFKADPLYLQRKLNITLVKDNVSALQALLKGRGEVAILNVSYLNQYLQANPDTADQLLISQKWDQQYQHRAILHPEAPITPAQLEQWLAVLQQKGELDRLWTKYGVQQHATP